MFTISTGPLITGFLASGGEVAKKTRRTHLVKSMVYEGYIYIQHIYICTVYIYVNTYIYISIYLNMCEYMYIYVNQKS